MHWLEPVILALTVEKLRQEEWQAFKVSLVYMVRPCLKANIQKERPKSSECYTSPERESGGNMTVQCLCIVPR